MLTFLFPSILVVLAFSIYGQKWKLFFLKMTGTIGMHMLVADGCETIEPIEKAQGVLGMIFILQTGPQLIIQTVNTLSIGQTLTTVQLASPVFAILALIEQFTGQWAKKGWYRQVPICIFLTLILPVIIIFFAAFDYSDRRPQWAKLHDFAGSLDHVPPPLINLEPI